MVQILLYRLGNLCQNTPLCLQRSAHSDVFIVTCQVFNTALLEFPKSKFILYTYIHAAIAVAFQGLPQRFAVLFVFLSMHIQNCVYRFAVLPQHCTSMHCLLFSCLSIFIQPYYTQALFNTFPQERISCASDYHSPSPSECPNYTTNKQLKCD